MIDVPTVNAFVTAACPRRVFVHAGLMDQVKPTDDELALIIGHEISHLLLQHGVKKGGLDAALSIFQLILLTFVEPVGFLSLTYDYLLGKVAESFDASYSRECEEEADTLGIELVARACYDTRKSVRAFEKLDLATRDRNLMFEGQAGPLSLEGDQSKKSPSKAMKGNAEVEEKTNKIKQHAAWNDGHPSFDDRIDYLTQLSEQFKSEKYSTCNSYLKRYIDSIATGFTHIDWHK